MTYHLDLQDLPKLIVVLPFFSLAETLSAISSVRLGQLWRSLRIWVLPLYAKVNVYRCQSLEHCVSLISIHVVVLEVCSWEGGGKCHPNLTCEHHNMAAFLGISEWSSA